MKIFVHTGPDFDNCQAAIPVEIDLIESGITTSTRYFLPFAQRTAGFQNSPRDLSTNRRKVAVNTTSDQEYIYVVEVSYLLRGKIRNTWRLTLTPFYIIALSDNVAVTRWQK